MRTPASRPLRILTWHVHGSYLYYLSHVPHEFYVPVKPGRPEGYGGRAGNLPWPVNLHEVPADGVRDMRFDCILFQSRRNYLVDQHEILSPAQRKLPRIFVEHDPPREHPTDTVHVVDDPDCLLVHVTAFNDLMWDGRRTPTRVIEHGVVTPPAVRYTGERPAGIVVVNDMVRRGRRLGADVFARVRGRVPLDLVGMGSRALGGLGEMPARDMLAHAAAYRFFFNPIRYTSLGLAVCEAMMIGMPVVALATTEMATVVENDVTGYADTDVERLVRYMRLLLAEPERARRLGEAARERARERFGIERFVRDWQGAFALVTGSDAAPLMARGAPA